MKNNKQFEFKSEIDFYDGIEWMKAFLASELKDSHKHDDPESVAEDIENLSTQLDSICFDENVEWDEIWDKRQDN